MKEFYITCQRRIRTVEWDRKQAKTAQLARDSPKIHYTLCTTIYDILLSKYIFLLLSLALHGLKTLYDIYVFN